MTDAQGLLFIFGFVAVVVLLNWGIMALCLAVERQEAQERRHVDAGTTSSTAGPPFLEGPAGTGVEQAYGKDASSLGPQPAGADTTLPQQSSAPAGLERRHRAGYPASTAGFPVAGPAVGAEAEQMRGIAAARSFGPHHSSSAGADSIRSSALAGIHRWQP